MPEPIRHAVILAAGRGTRMGEATRHTPKPLLRIHGRPMLDLILEHLSQAGIEHFFLVTGYLHAMIDDHIATLPLDITTRVQTVVNGTATAISLARDFAAARPFLLTFGDILCNPVAYTNCAQALTPDIAAVLGVREVEDPWQGAAVYAEGTRITKVIEKPPQGTSTTHWNSAGLYAMQPLLFPYLQAVPLSPRNEYEVTSIFNAMLTDGLALRISPIEGLWRDVGRPEDLEDLNR